MTALGWVLLVLITAGLLHVGGVRVTGSVNVCRVVR
jgi:hypothetical protein